MNYITICFWIILIIWIALLMLTFHKEAPKGDIKVKDITFHALIVALIVVMGFVPQAGYIQILPGISFSLIQLPVLIGAYKKGWKGGLLYGIAFGLTSWAQAAMSGTGFNALFIVPWVSVLPRAIFGLFAGFVFDLLRKTPKLYKNPFVVGAFSFGLTILHTVLVFAALFTFYTETLVGMFTSSSPVAEGVTYTFAMVIAFGMLGEATLGALLVPMVGKAISKARRN